MTIKNKLQFSSLVLFTLFLVIGATLLFGYRYVSGQASVSNAFDKQTMNLQMMLRGINEVIVTEGTPASVEIVEKGIHGFNEIHKYLLLNIKNKDLYKILNEEIDPEWKEINKGVKPFLEHHLDVEDENHMIQYGRVITDTDSLISKMELLSDKARAVVDSNSNKTQIVQKIIVAAIILSLIGISFLLYHLYRCINKPIQELSNMAEGFESGDLSITLNISKNDEFGVLASHFNSATSKLNDMISNIKNVTFTLSSDSSKLSSSAVEISNNAREQSDQTASAATAMEELSASFIEVARNTVEAAEYAKDATGPAVKGGEIVNETISGMNEISQSVNDSAVTIEELGSRSKEIGEIIGVINEIASQTNLLSLNAAIEAARAGEQGRGFAVVAEEVRKLSTKTASATDKIGAMIKGIQNDTNNAVETMEEGTNKVDTGVELANQAGEALKHIVKSSQNVTDMIQQIATAADEQTSAGNEISSNLERVANITHQTADLVQRSSESTQNLDALAQQLQQLVSGFRLKNESINNKDSQMASPKTSEILEAPG
jgi:methyl-accepting chemotaxis protein